jgi:hypothetical protein
MYGMVEEVSMETSMGKAVKKVPPDEQFLKSVTFPEEERRLYTSVPWCGGYRWFRSGNVICFEHYIRVAETNQSPHQKAS